MKIQKKINKIIPAGVLIILLTTAFVGATSTTLPNYDSVIKTTSPEKLDEYTHTVLVEAGTASWCPPCATAAAVMHDVFYTGDYDFYYVALVSDKNSYASTRCNELGVSSIPDYVFDGNYVRHVGSGGIPYAYTARLDMCGERDVSDIDLDLDLTWNGGGLIDVNLDITNNEASTYNGHLHVYVTEIVSRWNTNNGQPYHFAMIGNYAFNENVDITAGDTSQLTTSWDGTQYGVGDITEDNVMVIATVFDRNNQNFVDETTAESFGGLWPEDLELEMSAGLGSISARLKNNGTQLINDIDWSIAVEGGILKLIDSSTEGVVESLAAGEETVLQTNGTIFGFGKITVSANVNVGTKTEQGFIIGPFIIL